jgi:hypothetical protein
MEYGGAIHLVIHRGDRREEVFRDEQNHLLMGALRGASLRAHKPGKYLLIYIRLS